MSFIDRLFLKDTRHLSETLCSTDPCVDVIITSPPYWNLKNYEAPNQIGYGQTKDEYLSDMRKVFNDCLAVTKPTGSLWLVVDTYREEGELRLLPFELAELARGAGWKLRDLIVWDKQYSVPWQAKGQMRNTVEFILFMTKSDTYKYYVERVKTLDELSKWWVDFPERFNPKGKTPTNVWSIPIRLRGTWRKPSKNEHYCSFPTALVARIVELTTDPGDVVLDPFAGSGVVLAQASAMERHYIGFEVNKEYIKTFEDVKNEVNADWEEMLTWRKSQQNARIDFEQTIMKLRALKYTRQVTRPFKETLTPEQLAHVRTILCIATIPDKYQRGRPFDVDILIVVDQPHSKFEEALVLASNRSARPPLTQYGIRSEIQLCNYSDLKQHPEILDHTLYLYPKYKPTSYTGSGSIENWFKNGQLNKLSDVGKIPMLANVAVDVAWVLKKE